jgi:hypothetical protein
MPSARVVPLALAGLALLVGAPAASARRTMTLKFPRFTVPPHSDREVCTFPQRP